MRHGTIYAYTHKRCRCDECKDEMARYTREWRRARNGGCKPRPNGRGRSIRVRADVIRDALSADGRSVSCFCQDVGISCRSYYRIIQQGTGREPMIDSIACALGLHLSQVEVSK